MSFIIKRAYAARYPPPRHAPQRAAVVGGVEKTLSVGDEPFPRVPLALSRGQSVTLLTTSPE